MMEILLLSLEKVYDCHQGTDRHATDKGQRKNAKVRNTIVTFEDI